MQQADLFLIFTEPLESTGVDYMVSGSVACIVYGEPRLTNDIDIIVHLDGTHAARMAKAFPSTGFYCPPEEVIIIESRRRRRGHFNLIHHATGHKADMYISGDDPLHVWGFARRRRVDMGEDKFLWVAPPEYVILRKLEYFKEGGSEKHKMDIRGILEVSGEILDKSAINEWSLRLGVTRQWVEVASDLGFA
ncbi:MAG: hypothetical protein WCP86_07005 [bacterium]